MRFVPLVFCLALAGCFNPLGLLTKPGINANVQAGKTNSQTVGQTRNTEQSLRRVSAGKVEQSGTTSSQVKADQVQHVTVNNTAPWWIYSMPILTFLLGFVTPSHREIAAWFKGLRK